MHRSGAALCSAVEKKGEKIVRKRRKYRNEKCCNGHRMSTVSKMKNNVNNLRFWRTSRWLNKVCRANEQRVARRACSAAKAEALAYSWCTIQRGCENHTGQLTAQLAVQAFLSKLIAGRQPWKTQLFGTRGQKIVFGRYRKRKKNAPNAHTCRRISTQAGSPGGTHVATRSKRRSRNMQATFRLMRFSALILRCVN